MPTNQDEIKRMEWEGNLRKLRIEAAGVGGPRELRYALAGKDVLEEMPAILLNDCVGRELSISFLGQIHCVSTGKRISKAYGEGYSYDAWRRAPEQVESVIRPELSRIHEGIALRDWDWEEANHNQPHWVYITQTSGIKVGVTRVASGESRWFDQGAILGCALFEVPYRQLAGQIEVLLKAHMPDKTQWRTMLSDVTPNREAMEATRAQVQSWLGAAFRTWELPGSEMVEIRYPVEAFPQKLTSVSLDKVHHLEGRLVGWKGQYALFEDGRVLNFRSHAGYRVRIAWD